jgi:hypothetical protein
MTVSSIAVGSKGEAELLVHANSKLTVYSATPGGQFGAGTEFPEGGSVTNISVAIGCNGDGLMGWGRTGNLYTATNLTANPQCGSSGEEEEEEGPGDGGNPTGPGTVGGGAGGSGSGQTMAPVGPPTPAPRKPTALKCKKGFQKKMVRGKAKCVKKKTHKDKKNR